jgi:hypothetical protein
MKVTIENTNPTNFDLEIEEHYKPFNKDSYINETTTLKPGEKKEFYFTGPGTTLVLKEV